MPSRNFICTKMAEFLGAISHPCRIRIIEELRLGEKDVTSLQAILEISQSSISQHLRILRDRKALKQRKDGNHVFYSLAHNKLSSWLLEGLSYIEGGVQDEEEEVRSAVVEARQLWGNKSDV